MNNRDQALPKGTILHGKVYTYRIEKVLGQGTFGITYLASTSMQGPLGEVTVQVAVKEFFAKELDSRMADGTVTARTEKGVAHKYARAFLRESENLSKMKHPGIVNVLESFEDKGTCYYSMEYLSGGCLDDKVKGQGIPEEEALKITTKIGEALAYMHEQKVMHLDLKPKNVMLKADGSPVIIDFGLSKQYDEKGEPESSTTIGLGTPGYAPIEQANQTSGRKFQPTIDIYALGATLYKMLTGETPPNASDIFNEGFPEEPLVEKGVSPATVNAIRKAMSAAKKDRPQNMSEFLAIIAGDEETTLDPPTTKPGPQPNPNPEPTPTPPTPSPDKGKSKAWLWVSISGIAVLLIIGLIFFSSRLKKPIPDRLLINGNSVCKIELESAATECEFTIEKNFEERWVYYGVPEWCTPTAEVGRFTLSVSENKTKDERTATIIFQKKDGKAVLGNLIVNQKAKGNSKKNKEQETKETKVGSIQFASAPSGAAIWIDGKNTNKTTPNIIDGITVGKHNVKLALEGYEDYSGIVIVSSNECFMLGMTLKEKGGNVNNNFSMDGLADPVFTPVPVKVDRLLGTRVLRTKFFYPFENKLMENAEALELLNTIDKSPSLEVTSFDIEGWYSPEATVAESQNLSLLRAKALKDYISGKYKFPKDVYSVKGNGEYWDSIIDYIDYAEEKIVAENRAYLQDAIATNDDLDKRETAIRKIADGQPYKAIFDAVYPRCRFAEAIVTFNVVFTKASAIAAYNSDPSSVSADEYVLWIQDGAPSEAAETAVKLYPNDVRVAVVAADKAYEDGDVDKAIALYKKAGSTEEVMNNLACCYIKKGDYKNARDCLTKTAK